MTALAQEKCSACKKDSPRVTDEEVAELKPLLPNWHIIEISGVPRLEGAYKFPDFQTALEFANRVGAIAEEEEHHPALLIEWGKVTVSWWTHAIRGLHRNDFIMAAKTDAIASEFLEK